MRQVQSCTEQLAQVCSGTWHACAHEHMSTTTRGRLRACCGPILPMTNLTKFSSEMVSVRSGLPSGLP